MNNISAKQIRIWVRKISESDQKAFDSLFRHYYTQLVHFGCRYVKNKATASDIVQECFVKLWEKRHGLDPNQSIKAYLYQMVRNRSLNYIRNHSREQIGLEWQQQDNHNITDGHVEEEKSADDEFFEVLRQWIDELPGRQQEAFKLSRFEGLDHEEIAEVMDISSNTVNNHIVAALQTLRDRYNEYQEVKNG
jgi:RNA polymerase sigma-70 factor (ECF subfamily)